MRVAREITISSGRYDSAAMMSSTSPSLNHKVKRSDLVGEGSLEAVDHWSWHRTRRQRRRGAAEGPDGADSTIAHMMDDGGVLLGNQTPFSAHPCGLCELPMKRD